MDIRPTCPLIDTHQYGNMKLSSSTHCLISLLDVTYKNIENRKTSVAVTLIDFKIAFDLVEHTSLINKAINLSLLPCIVSRLTDLRSQRTQVVKYQGVASTRKHQTCGVPQGTKIGPMCLLILITDALEHTPHRWNYTDYTTPAVTIDKNNPNYAPLQTLCNALQSMTAANSVTINGTKTTFLQRNTSSGPFSPLQVSVNNTLFQVVKSAKLLRVIY